MRRPRPTRTVTRLAAMSVGGRVSLLALTAAALLAGCGGDDATIPADRGEQLLTRLDEIEGAVADGECEGAQASAELFSQQAQDLPADVDAEVKRLLIAGGQRLQELAAEQCEEATTTGPSGETGFQPETPEEQPGTTSTTSSTAEEEPPPDEGGDNGGESNEGSGSQNGGGQSGGNQNGGTGTGGVGGGGI
jgi:hypothetical protein